MDTEMGTGVNKKCRISSREESACSNLLGGGVDQLRFVVGPELDIAWGVSHWGISVVARGAIFLGCCGFGLLARTVFWRLLACFVAYYSTA
jgi:hypothetical protein